MRPEELNQQFPPPWRWARRWAMLPISCVVILLIGYLTWAIRARQLLNQELAVLSSADLEFIDRSTTTLDPAHNAAQVFLDAAARLKLSRNDEQRLIALDSLGETHPSYRTIIERNATAIAACTPAASLTQADWTLPLADTTGWPIKARQCFLLQRILLAASGWTTGPTADVKSLSLLQTSMALGKAFRARPSDTALNDASASDYASLQTFRELLPRLDVNDAQVSTALMACQKHWLTEGEEPWPDLARRALALRRARLWQTLPRRLVPSESWSFALPPMRDATRGWLLQTYRRAIDACTPDNWPEMRSVAPAVASAVSLADFHSRPLRLDDPAIRDDAFRRNHFAVLARQRMAAVAIALRFYSAAHHGKLPNTLQDLIPTYLAKVPTDPQSPTHEPIHYLPAGDFPLLYCLGVNGIDDHATFINERGEWLARDTLPRMKDEIFLLSAKWPPPPAAD